MVGYGAHTRVPHMSSPLFSWLAYWMEVNRLIIFLRVDNPDPNQDLQWLIILIILIRICSG